MRSSLTTVLTAAIFALISTGCVNLQYSKYTGHDTSEPFGAWPISQGTMAETRFAVPVYRGWPEKPYQLLGSLSHEDPNARWNDDFFAAAARKAKGLNGDAVIIREGAEFGVSQIASAARERRNILSSHQTTALVIRWLTPKEINDRNLLLGELLNRFFANDPTAVTANRKLGWLV
jgi:hypothetical protein